MKKLIAGLGLLIVVGLMSLGLVAPASADNGYTPDSGDEDTSTSTVDSSTTDAGTSPTAGVLPSTGGPQTLLLVGGAALVVVGGAALVVSRRRGARS